MKIDFMTSVAVITSDASASRALSMDAPGLPLRQLDGDDYASEDIAGCRHFGVWPLTHVAEACFGTRTWPDGVARPQVSVEFEMTGATEVSEGARELRSSRVRRAAGHVVARLLSPEGAVSACPTHRPCTTPRADGTSSPSATGVSAAVVRTVRRRVRVGEDL